MHHHPSGYSAGRSPGKALGLAAASAVLPGLAHWVAGRRRTAAAIFAVALLLLAGLTWLAVHTSRVEALRPGALASIILVAVGLALIWIVLVNGSFRVLNPARTHGAGKAGVVLVLTVLSLLVATPPLAVARYAYLQRSLINDIFGEDPSGGIAAGENGSGTVNDAWKGRNRVTILLLASDAGPDRDGTRTDSMVAASIDTHTGDVVMLSLPRNLQEVQMPPGPLRDAWPNGFPELLNGVYKYVTDNPKLLAGYKDRGAEAIKRTVSYILGIPVDYYAMADLAGFQTFVSALGGVKLTVTERLPIGGLLADGTRVPPVDYIEPGTQTLSGYQALWYARSRRDSTDYERMARQRCLIGAMVRQADPLNVLRHFTELTSATKKLASTDIPRSILPDLVTLGDKMHSGNNKLRSVAFVPPLIHTGNPDFAKIRKVAQAAIKSTAAAPTPSPSTSASPKPSSSPGAPKPSSSKTAAGASPVDVDAACGIT
jgi:LCP family protein required for cell wall assembly